MANWLRFILKCLPFFLKLFLGLIQNFFASVSHNFDTLYLDWNTSFPALTVCEIYNGEKIWDLSDHYFGSNHDLHIDDFVGEVVFFRGTCTTCEKCDHIKCPQNFTELLTLFRSKCSELLSNCKYINQPFNCCDEFLPIRTEYGICFAFNSNQARKNDHMRFASNRETGPAYLQFDASADIQLYIHSTLDIPLSTFKGMIRETVLLGSEKEIIINIIDVYNHASVYQLSLDQRRCRLSHELTDWGRELGIYEFYSNPTCLVECNLAEQLLHCNCSSHFLTPAVKPINAHVPMCDYRGLSCLTMYNEEIQLKTKSCNCPSSCEETEYTIVYSSPDSESNRQLTTVRVALIDLPTQRYVRRVTNTPLDLLISVGGITGLFFSASFVRLFEFIYLLKEFKLKNFWKQF